MSEQRDVKPRRSRRLRRQWKGVQRSAANAMTILRKGRLSAPYRAPFEVVIDEPVFRLRRYVSVEPTEAPSLRGPLLLIPPLMLTSEVYDISPELSAVSWLLAQGIDVWLVDFGAPEEHEGGFERTLDDHVLAIDKAVSEVNRQTGSDVHLAGYSQGGMFAYQTAAYRRSVGIKSVITFGSPVDVRKMIPIAMPSVVATRLIAGGRRLVDGPLEEIRALPGFLTSTAFKLLSARKEVEQVIEFLGLLPNRDALAQREPRRRFLNGEGFVAWPAPALRRLIDEVVVKNLLAQGGLVINQRPVTLADIRVPILSYVGLRDEIATPASVRAIHRAAPEAAIYEVTVQAGHFGLVVGSRALSYSWPKLAEWIRWHEGVGEQPAFGALDTLDVLDVDSEDEESGGVREMYDAAAEWLDVLWTRVGDATVEISDTLETMRWQIPRLARMRRLRNNSRINAGRALMEQAEAIPDHDFFLWGDRAWTYAEADARVNRFVHVLHDQGIQKGDHVGVLMNNHPDYLTVVVALNRMGAIAVLFNSGLSGRSLAHAFSHAPTRALIIDPAHTDAAAAYEGQVFRTGSDEAVEGIFDLLPALNSDVIDPPEGLPVNEGLGSDVAILMFTSGTTGLPRAARITNRRWASAALGAAAALQLTDRDTVYCSLPLYHSTGLLIGCGGALVGGARLALAPKFSTTTFWNDVHRYGATVVIYVGELCRYLVNGPESSLERSHSVRAFVGNGMRADVWEQVLARFGRVRVLEFYGSTEGNVVLANLEGRKIGSVGREMLPETTVELVRYDHRNGEFLRDAEGALQPCDVNEPGVLLAKISDVHPLSQFDGYVDETLTQRTIVKNAFGDGGDWFNTGDMLRRDEEGDFWFVDRVGDTYRWKGENVSTEEVANVLQNIEGVDVASVYGIQLPNREGRAGMAAIQLRAGARFDADLFAKAVEEHLFPAARPRFIRIVEELPVTSTLKLVKNYLQTEGADPRKVSDALYVYDEQIKSYRGLSTDNYERYVQSV